MTSLRLSAIIVDDEPLAIEGVRRLCERHGAVDVIGEATDGPGAIEMFGKLQPDAVFLEIAMPGLSGLDVAKFLALSPEAPRVVVVTAKDHFASEAFDLRVFDYVLKPIVPERLFRAIDRIAALVESDGAKSAMTEFWVPYRGSVVRLHAADIIRVEAERDYVRIVAVDRSYLLRATLSDMASRLDHQDFLRIHRSTILRRDRIVGVRHVAAGAWVAIEPEGVEFAIGRSYLDAVRERIGLV